MTLQAQVGALITSAIKYLVMTILVTTTLLSVLMIGQALQYHYSSHELRNRTLQHWQARNPEQSQLIQEFVERCLKHRPRNQATDKEIALYDCGRNVGAHDLIEELEQTDLILTRLAWPLSLLERIHYQIKS